MILTVGHSTHPLEEFLALLHGAQAGTIVDVRRLPGSNRYPWFNQDSLVETLPAAGISYDRIVELTGRRSRQRDVPDSVNGFWDNRSFHNYADYAMSADFDRGVDRLIALAESEPAGHHPAVMCSEAVWWRCHRRLIADHLIARGQQVGHLMPDGRVTPAELTRGAVVSGTSVTYPRLAD